MFIQLKSKLKEEYPSIENLSLFQILLAKINGDRSEVIKTVETTNEKFSQTAVLLRWKGKDYLERFGRLK